MHKIANQLKTNYKTNLSEQKTTKATIFHAEKRLRVGKLVILCFIKKTEFVLITSFTILLPSSIDVMIQTEHPRNNQV